MRRVRKALLEKDGEYLILKRPNKGRRYANCWDLPGGKVDEGEDPLTALKREVKEETGLEVEVGEELLRFEVEGEDIEMGIYAVSCEGECEIKLSSEHVSYKWVDMQELLDLKSCEITLERYIQGLY